MSRDIKAPVPGWAPPPAPPADLVLHGRHARLVPLSPDHAAELAAAFSADPDGRSFDFLPYGPFRGVAAWADWIAAHCGRDDPHFFAITAPADGRALGVASYLRIQPQAGSIEVGHLSFSPALRATPAATEAMFLMMQWAFEAGYRRYEWKCDAANAASRRAAERLGLSFEGMFRQAGVVKGRNRDTAWFAAIDAEWPALRDAFARWLRPENFDDAGRQIARLWDLTAPIRVSDDPARAGGTDGR